MRMRVGVRLSVMLIMVAVDALLSPQVFQHVLVNHLLLSPAVFVSALSILLRARLSQVLHAYMEAERTAAAAAVTEGPLAAAQAQLETLQVMRCCSCWRLLAVGWSSWAVGFSGIVVCCVC